MSVPGSSGRGLSEAKMVTSSLPNGGLAANPKTEARLLSGMEAGTPAGRGVRPLSNSLGKIW